MFPLFHYILTNDLQLYTLRTPSFFPKDHKHLRVGPMRPLLNPADSVGQYIGNPTEYTMWIGKAGIKWIIKNIIMAAFKKSHLKGSAQDCSIYIANALGILQSCTQPSIWYIISNITGGSVALLSASCWYLLRELLSGKTNTTSTIEELSKQFPTWLHKSCAHDRYPKWRYLNTYCISHSRSL